jgi:hypothetical protein
VSAKGGLAGTASSGREQARAPCQARRPGARGKRPPRRRGRSGACRAGARASAWRPSACASAQPLPATAAPLPDPSPPTARRRARKLRRAVTAVAPLLGASRSEVAYLEEVESEVAQLADYGGPEDLAALREVQDELAEAGVVRPPPDAALAAKAAAKGRRAAKKAGKGGGGGAGGAAAAAAGGGQGFRRYVSPGGHVILVGRNNRQNDVLSHQVANPQDLWMHVRGLPGSHTLLRVEPGGGAPGDDDVACAAALAAWFSKARGSGKADVIVTRAGAGAGPRARVSGERMYWGWGGVFGAGPWRAWSGGARGAPAVALARRTWLASSARCGIAHRGSTLPTGRLAADRAPAALPSPPAPSFAARTLRAEHVRKLKGGKPGQVLLAKEERVVVAKPHESLAAAAAASGGGGD